MVMKKRKSPLDGQENSDSMRIRYNTAPIFDRPYGEYCKGEYGESLLNAGLGQSDLIAAPGNVGKTTHAITRMARAMKSLVIMHLPDEDGVITPIPAFRSFLHETENQGEMSRYTSIIKNNFDIPGIDVYNDELFKYYSETDLSAENLLKLVKTLRDDNLSYKKADKDPTPFFDMDGNRVLIPMTYFGIEDSLTHMESSKSADIREKTEAGSSDRNMLAMHGGKFKGDFLRECNSACAGGNIRFQYTGHITEKFSIDPYATGPQVNSYLKGVKIGGVSNQSSFLCSNIIYMMNVSDFKHDTTKGVWYPRSTEENNSEVASDLKRIKVISIRAKGQGNGVFFEYISSQNEGMLPELSMYHALRKAKFGICSDGFSLELYPIKAQRTTVRTIISNDPMFRRAIEITWGLYIERLLFPQRAYELPKNILELKEKIENKGYKWEQLLNTREWWAIYNDKHPIPFLSSADLFNMANGVYVPYWL